MNSIFILHGSFGSPFENWFPWFYGEAKASKRECFIPSFPTPEGQTFANWSIILDGYRQANILSADSTIVGHSSAAVFAVKYLMLHDVAIRRLVTVSGFNQFFSGDANFDRINEEFFVETSDLDKCKHYAASIDCFFSQLDPYLPLNTLREFCEKLGGVPHEIPGGGHFNAQAGYSRFEELRQLLIV